MCRRCIRRSSLLLGGAIGAGGQVEAAVELLEKAIAEKAYLAGGRYNEYYLSSCLGIALTRCGRFADARNALQQARASARFYEQHGHIAEAAYWSAKRRGGRPHRERALAGWQEAVTLAQACSMDYWMESAKRHAAMLEAMSTEAISSDRAPRFYTARMSSRVAAALSALRHRFVSRLVHQPKVLRVFTGALRRWPSSTAPRPWRRAALRCCRYCIGKRAFSNAAQASSLVAGEFAIGMEAGERHQQDREFLQSVLPQPNQWADLSADKVEEVNPNAAGFRDAIVRSSQRLSGARRVEGFGKRLRNGGRCNHRRVCSRVARIRARSAKRWRPVDLWIGRPECTQARRRQRTIVTLRLKRALSRLKEQQRWTCLDRDAIKRNAVGLLWVGHPATVQAGALVMQELLSRRAVCQQLTSAAREVAAPCRDAEFRHRLRGHVRVVAVSAAVSNFAARSSA